MVKVEVVYEGAGTKVSLSDGRTLKLKDKQKVLVPLVDYQNSLSISGNFTLTPPPEGWKNLSEENSKKSKKKKSKRGGK